MRMLKWAVPSANDTTAIVRLSKKGLVFDLTTAGYIDMILHGFSPILHETNTNTASERVRSTL
jgi:hypothetical protein